MRCSAAISHIHIRWSLSLTLLTCTIPDSQFNSGQPAKGVQPHREAQGILLHSAWKFRVSSTTLISKGVALWALNPGGPRYRVPIFRAHCIGSSSVIRNARIASPAKNCQLLDTCFFSHATPLCAAVRRYY
ncbi:hypothetical protein BJX76DRAFT_204112 [Aspergillus varians]